MSRARNVDRIRFALGAVGIEEPFAALVFIGEEIIEVQGGKRPDAASWVYAIKAVVDRAMRAGATVADCRGSSEMILKSWKENQE